MKAVLDAGALVAIDRRDREVGAQLRLLQQQGTPLRTSAAAVGPWRSPRRYWRSIVTGATPDMPSCRAAAGVTSMIRPLTKGPRSLIVTTTERPFL